MKAKDANKFQNTIIKEVNARVKNHWEIIPSEQFPKVEQFLPSIWEFKQKRDIKSNLVLKYKVCLNICGGKQEYTEILFEDFSPVVTWFTIIMVIVLSIINGWITHQVEFFLTFT